MHYLDDGSARAALAAAADRRFSQVVRTRTAMVAAVEPYRSGKLYLRELPPLRAVIPAADELALIVVDGYVDLDPDGRPGLGARVHAEFGVPVIGVAKTAFQTATHAASVLRGQSTRPLYVTAAGMTIADAAVLVTEMAGRFRVPDALKRVDQLARAVELPDARPGELPRRIAASQCLDRPRKRATRVLSGPSADRKRGQSAHSAHSVPPR